jgi:radical SAM superfamily enzyme YgiQ (UPF0313 family)
VGQASITVAHDQEALDLMRRSGCLGILVGFESLHEDALAQMNKSFNLARGGPATALDAFRRHGLAVYGTFVFGYDSDGPESFNETVAFAREHAMFIAAFNHITPFPGTPLYRRLEEEGRLEFEAWWLDERYRYNMVPFRPRAMSAEALAEGCLRARREFYSWPSVLERARASVNRSSVLMAANYLVINAMHRRDIEGRSGLALGDASWRSALVPAR